MAQPGAGVGATTLVEVENVTAVASLSLSDQIAKFLADDLMKIAAAAKLNLADSLNVNDEAYPTENELLIELLCNDLEQMVAARVITGVHFMLCESSHGGLGGTFRVGYHAEYQLSATRPDRGAPQEEIGRIRLPPDAALWQRFVLLIDWDPRASPELLRDMHRPEYFFDWLPPNIQPDTSNLVLFDRGGLGNVVIRLQYATPAAFRGA